MKIKNNIKIALAAFVVAFSATSCNDWLNVEMEDAIMENTLFSNDEGYLSTLTGCYVRMNQNYENILTRGGIDVMAQYYHVTPLTEHSMINYALYKYDQLEGTNGNVWTQQYENIANLNVLLNHLDKDNKLSEKYYNYVKGEALALRAFLHFDLMRLYGPIYGPDTENKTTIPYQETHLKDIQPLLPAKEVMEKIIRDLNDALVYLKNDRIIEDGTMNESVSDEKPTLRYRQFRMNYFATKLLLARVYMWIGDKEKAEEVANEVIKENNKQVTDGDGQVSTFTVFPWVNKATQLDSPNDGNPDRIFSTEVMFGVYDSKRANFYHSNNATTLNINGALFLSDWTQTGEYYWDPSYEYNKMTQMLEDINDLRRRYQWVASKINGGAEETWSGYYLLKFEPLQNPTGANGTLTDISKTAQYMLPLIRLSEAYLIVAECEAEKGNLKEAIDNINIIRVHRNTPDLALLDNDTKATVKNYITMEFMREMVGEGQLFFYYKRNAMDHIMAGAATSDTPMTEMNLANYTWPIPKVEMDKRVTK